MKRAGWTWLTALLFTLVAARWWPSPARAQEPSTCAEAVAAWVERCPEIHRACVAGVHCPPGHVVLDAGCEPDERLRVDVSRATSRAFRQIGALGVSPVGDFPDWSKVAEGKRRSLDAIGSCLEKDPSLLLPRASPGGGEPLPRASGAPVTEAPVPWRLLAGVGLAVLVCRDRWRATRERRTALLLGLLFACTLGLRALTFPAAFFHPNGQGAFWIGFALEANGLHSPYGPGYRELFGWLAQLELARPERLVIWAQASAGASSAVCAWVIARGLGGGRALAWAAGVAVASSPILARISQSQSYYGTWAALLFAATAILVVGVPRSGERPRRLVWAAVAAGFLVAQAARVTPIGWLAGAVVPLVVAAHPGRPGPRLRWTVVVGLVMAAVVAAASGHAMLGVLRGSLGAQWLPLVNADDREWWRSIGAAAPWLVVLVIASQRRAHAFLRVLALVAVIALMEATCMVRSDPESFRRAYVAMWSPVLLALAVALAAGLRTRALRAAAAGALLALATTLHVTTWRADRELPTNVLESIWAEGWREKLPPRSTVVYLGRVGHDVLALPLYGAHSRVPIEPWVLTRGDPVPDLGRLGANVYYYESSLCAAPAARDLCRELRARYGLQPIERTDLPARESRGSSFFEGGRVSVALHRVR